MTKFKRKIPGILIVAFLGILMNACSSSEPSPRPRGWPRIDLPDHKYKIWSNDQCPFSFELPESAVLELSKPDSCVLNFYFKDFECRWHITYRHIPTSGKTIDQHSEEYRRLAFKHVQQAQIQPRPIEGPAGFGTFYELYGNIGVPAQFNFGDSTHIILTSFYFDTAVKSDSLSPIIDFVKEDLHHMIYTLRWKE